ncbi:hypothetical protein VPZ86_001242 [Salmonella enterica]|nr:hypothetical protein [Salmonella enterica]EKR1707871.1 hypothetical protein [Salmonella enterica subsp. enterica serovar Carrau]EBT7963554.1 hypothetical protein [Salmonella enterica]ECP4145114.1 hypothetical protein [Salmonella enterica]EDY4580500.1 hypothetical protein [Salmonella enterica]
MTRPPKGYEFIEDSKDFHDQTADLAGATSYLTRDGYFINISFFRTFVKSLRHKSNNMPDGSLLTMQRFTSVTISEEEARALYESLGKAIEMIGTQKKEGEGCE